MTTQHAYEVRPRKDHRGVELISDALPFGRLWYGGPNAVSDAFDSAKIASRRSRIGNSKVDEEAHRADLEMHVEAEALDDATNRPFKLGIRLGWAVTLKNVMRLAMLFVRLPTGTSSMIEHAQR